jgi:uncharacterized membrane protein YkoI
LRALVGKPKTGVRLKPDPIAAPGLSPLSHLTALPSSGRLTRERRLTMKKLVAIVASALAAAAVAAGIAIGAGGKDDETPITGTALTRASEAALAHTGGGRVTDTEAGDEEGAYEVEVTLDDGRQVDVHLDASFDVIGDEAEDGAEEDDDD